MGATVSTTHKIAERVDVQNVEAEVIPFVLPIYYTDEVITQVHLEAALKGWKLILNNRSEHFLALKRANGPDVQDADNCMDYFMHNFYIRLFDIHPNCKKLFHRSIHKQGSFFLRFLSMCVAEVSEPTKLDKTMENLANIHNKMGVKAVEYGIAGEALFHTVQKCIGPEFTPEAAIGWTKIYSVFLKYLIPYVVRFELANKDQSKAIANKRNGKEVAQDMFTKHESVSTAAPANT